MADGSRHGRHGRRVHLRAGSPQPPGRLRGHDEAIGQPAHPCQGSVGVGVQEDRERALYQLRGQFDVADVDVAALEARTRLLEEAAQRHAHTSQRPQ